MEEEGKLNKDENSGISFSKTKEYLNLIIGYSGIFLALLWITGRAFASGYFDAMNVPIYLVNFSIYEYAENTWNTIAILIVLIIISFCIIYYAIEGLIMLLEKYIFPLIRRIISSLKIHLKMDYKEKPINKTIIDILKISLIITEIIILISILQFIEIDFGEYVGRNVVNGSSMNVGIESEIPLGIGTPEIINNDGQNIPLYYYTGLRLLTFNSNKYYVFTNIDPITCKPQKVFIIDNANLVKIELSPGSVINNRCNK